AEEEAGRGLTARRVVAAADCVEQGRDAVVLEPALDPAPRAARGHGCAETRGAGSGQDLPAAREERLRVAARAVALASLPLDGGGLETAAQEPGQMRDRVEAAAGAERGRPVGEPEL